MTTSHSPADSTDSGAAAAANELFLRNMRSLWRNDPSLAMRVDAVDDEDRLPVTRTKSGAWTVRVPTSPGTGTGAGAAVFLHSRYDPVAEAERFIESVPLEDKYCLFVAGLGLGYHVRILLDRLRGDAFVVCGEPSIPLIATALTCVDLAEPIALGRLIFLTDGDKSRLHERMKDRNTLMMLGAQFVHHPPSMRVAEKEHKAILGAMKDFASYSRMTLVTLLSNSRITCENIAMNLERYVSTPPIDLLRDRFKGDPAIVISAGPSLSRNIDQLAALKGRAVLCAVQTTLRPLLERGIVPDFATSLDFHEMSTKFFEGVGDLSQTHLVAEPKATWPVIDNYPGPVSLLESSWAKLLIGEELAGRGSLQAGATVSHLAFYLAVYMGCDPIIFVGQDLAFTGHVFYVPGVEIHRAWRGELNRFNTMEHKEWDRIVRNRPILRRVTGVDGEPVYTDELLLTYLEQFEKDIAAVANRVINATEGGARINGTETMTLADAAERFCGREIDPERFAYQAKTSWHDDARLAPTRDELQRRIAELDDVVTVCDELLTLLRELDGITNDPLRFNRRLVRVDELRTKISDQSRAYLVVNAFTQLAELRRYSADRRIKAGETDDAERAKAQIARDIDFITGVREGAVDLKPILVRACKRVCEKVHDEPSRDRKRAL